MRSIRGPLQGFASAFDEGLPPQLGLVFSSTPVLAVQTRRTAHALQVGSPAAAPRSLSNLPLLRVLMFPSPICLLLLLLRLLTFNVHSDLPHPSTLLLALSSMLVLPTSVILLLLQIGSASSSSNLPSSLSELASTLSTPVSLPPPSTPLKSQAAVDYMQKSWSLWQDKVSLLSVSSLKREEERPHSPRRLELTFGAYIPTTPALCSSGISVECNDLFGTSVCTISSSRDREVSSTDPFSPPPPRQLSRATFRFPTGSWSKISLFVRLNSPAEASNGVIQLYFNSELALTHENLQIRYDASLPFLFRTFSPPST